MIPSAERQSLREAATKDPGSAPAADHLDSVHRLLNEALPELERAVLGATTGALAPLDVAAQHLLAAGGKRVRPLACMLVARALEGDLGKAIPLAAAAELVHSATLLHDDVIDEGEERRNRPASRVLWGNLVSVLSGDLLLTRALCLVEQAGVPGAMQDLLQTLERLIAGEVHQLNARGQLDLGADGYFAIVGGKTASLFGFACRAGVRSAGRNELLGPASAFGEKVGIAFQIIDDVLDLSGDAQEVGKRLGADLAEGKTTLPLALAMRDDDGTLAALLPAARQGDEKAARAVSAHAKVRRGCAEARDIADGYSTDALAALDQLPPSRARELLRGLAHTLTRRRS
jgi:octaprenyl-diphosphate synthase